MKFTITITKEEKDNTTKAIWVDPCKHIRCGSIDCAKCPFQAQAEKLRTAQDEFLKTLEGLAVEEE